jgi:hypothetical protein
MNEALGLMAKRLDHATVVGVARDARHDWNSEKSPGPFAVIKRHGSLRAAPLGRAPDGFPSLQTQRLAPFRRNHLWRPNRIPNDVHLGRSDRG